MAQLCKLQLKLLLPSHQDCSRFSKSIITTHVNQQSKHISSVENFKVNVASNGVLPLKMRSHYQNNFRNDTY